MDTRIRSITLGSLLVALLSAAASAVTPLMLVPLEPGCHDVGEVVRVNVRIGAGPDVVAGGQFLVVYNPACLQFINVEPGRSCDPASPFVMEIFQVSDVNAGTIFFAVGIATTGRGTRGPATMACLEFVQRSGCSPCTLCFASHNPQNTLLSGPSGQNIPYVASCATGIRATTTVQSTCPANVETQVPCDDATVQVNWSPPQIVDSCQGMLALTCTAIHDGGADIDHLTTSGGAFPIGTSTFQCAAVDGCGQGVECHWTVLVHAAFDADCDDGVLCTRDSCDPNRPGAGPDGCSHEHTVILYGDLRPPGGVELNDVLCILNAFGNPGSCPGADLYPCGGSGVVDLGDLFAVLDAFSGDYACPHPCPP